MAYSSRSPYSVSNTELHEKTALEGEGNSALLARLAREDGISSQDGIILLGGTSLADFRVRVAQSLLRQDMQPSFWSICGILLPGEKFVSTPFELSNPSEVPAANAVQECLIENYDDPNCYPNIAVIRFAKSHDNVHRDIERLKSDRSIINLPALMLSWLGFIWGAPNSANPLMSGSGLPSAAFVETVFAMSGFELTPGLSSGSSCPEAIWQSAKWWAGYYQEPEQEGQSEDQQSGSSAAMVPKGFYVVRQKQAIIFEG
jgi:hypothetical protein